MTEESHKHVLFLTAVLVGASCGLEIQVTGELHFDVIMRMVRARGQEKQVRAVAEPAGAPGAGVAVQSAGVPSVTAAPQLECPYQYPDLQQFNAVLSNMMNELTSVFVQAHQMMRAEDGRRALPSRFKVVSEKTSHFFEDNFANMTKEFGKFFNSTWLRVSRAQDPCENQEELKRLWRELLETALVGLHKAAAQCIDQCLKAQPHNDKYSTRIKLEAFLVKELARIKVDQLSMLCDHFQLCYSDLL